MKRSKLIAWILVIVLVIAATGWFVLFRPDQNTILKRAKIAYYGGQYSKAAELANRYITKNPSDQDGYITLARSLVNLGKYKQARQNFELAEKIKPISGVGLSDYARSYTLHALDTVKSSKPDNRAQALDEAQVLVNHCELLLQKARPQTEYDKLTIQRLSASNTMYNCRIYMQLRGEYAKLAKLYRSGRSLKQYAQASQKLQLIRIQNQNTAQQACEQLIKSALDIKKWLDANPESKHHKSMSVHCSTAVNQLVNLLSDRHEIQQLQYYRAQIITLKDAAPAAVCKAEIKLLTNRIFYDSKTRKKAVKQTLTLVDSMMPKVKESSNDWTALSLARANLMLMNEKPAQAEEICEVILAQHPTHHQARFVYAQSLIAQKKQKKALAVLFVLKGELGASAVVSMMYANLARDCGQDALALQTVNNIIKFDPSYIPAIRYLIKHHLTEGHKDLAFLQAVDYLEYYPEDPDALKTLALCAIMHKRKLELQQSIERTLKNYPDNSLMTLAVADIYIKTGEPDKAIGLANSLISKNRSDLKAWQKLVGYLSDNPAQAMDALSRMKRIFPYESVMAETRLMLKWGLVQRAKMLLKQLETMDKLDDNRLKMLAALASFYTNEPERAKQYLEMMDKSGLAKLTSHTPSTPQNKTQLDPSLNKHFKEAYELEVSGKVQQATKMYLELTDCSDKYIAAASCNNAAWLLSKETDRLAQATELSRKAYSSFPTNPYFMDTLGWVTFLNGDNAQARTILRTALKLSKQDHNIHRHISEVEKKFGNVQVAQWHLQEATFLEDNK